LRRGHTEWLESFGLDEIETGLTGLHFAGKRLTAGQGNRGAPEAAALGSDDNRLPVAARCQGKIGIETAGTRNHLEVAGGSASSESPLEPAGAFAPGSGEFASLGDDVTSEIEFVAVAGAEQGEVEAGASSANGIGCPAADAFHGSVLEADISPAGPNAGHPSERP
jgi:hypothetical protein